MGAVDNRIKILKGAGKIDEVNKRVNFNSLNGTIGISHTRWATHGGVTDINAHPQVDCEGKIAVVHNGIIENYIELKEKLIKKGHKFRSETDTEVISHLIEDYIKDGKSYREAVLETSRQLRGLFAFIVINEGEKNKIIVSNTDAL
jgi:glucosamine--fructose-6-phosphate aminotransferase (isomerizing)